MHNLQLVGGHAHEFSRFCLYEGKDGQERKQYAVEGAPEGTYFIGWDCGCGEQGYEV